MEHNIIEGGLSSTGLRFAIIVARFNSFITDRLLTGALDALKRTGAAQEQIDIIRIPGSWEFPLTARTVAAQKRHEAIICLAKRPADSRASRRTLEFQWRSAC